MTNKITIGIKEPGKPWEIREVKDELPTYQKIVGGYIEGVDTMRDGLHIFCNEEGKLQGLEPNFGLNGDIIVGPAFAVRSTEEGEFASITTEDIEWLEDWPLEI
jgi:hypothetical protein